MKHFTIQMKIIQYICKIVQFKWNLNNSIKQKIYTMEVKRYTIQIEIIEYKWKLHNINGKLQNANKTYSIQMEKNEFCNV